MTQIEINLMNLKQVGIIDFVSTLDWMDPYLDVLKNDELGEVFPVFPERIYEWGTKEYIASLSISCFFGTKSLDREIAFSAQSRLNYNIVRWTEL